VSEKIEVTKRDIIAVAAIAASLIGSLIYGYFLLKKETPNNCWSQYTTEQAAINACETHKP
jgi:hypothetical protein